MTQVLEAAKRLETTKPLTDDEWRQVQTFAEFLIARRGAGPSTSAPDRAQREIDVDGLIGLCKGMGGDKSDKELIREAWDAVVAKYDR